MVKSVFKEKHTPIRIVQNVPVILVLITMLMQILCGIILSKYAFSFADFSEPLLMYIADDIAIMGLFVFVGYYLSKIIKNIKGKGL